MEAERGRKFQDTILKIEEDEEVGPVNREDRQVTS
jgi:hypothetical protein